MSHCLQKEKPEMSNDVIYSFDQTFTDNLLSFGQVDIHNTITTTTTTTRCVTVKHKVQIFFNQSTQQRFPNVLKTL